MFVRSVLAAPRPGSGVASPFISMQRALRAFDDIVANSAALMPVELDVREDENAFHVSADLPGLGEKDVEVTFLDGVLTIRGEKKVTREEKKDTWQMVERSSGSFQRTLSIGVAIEADKIEAKFDKGVLSVTLPKMPQVAPSARKIEIKAT